MGKVCFFVFAWIAPAFTQNRLVLEPGASPAATAPAYEVSFGYVFHTMLIPGASNDSLSGFDASGHFELTPRWSAALDSSYVRTSDVLGTGHEGHVLSFLAGPELYPIEEGRSSLFVHALAGLGLVDAAAANNPDYWDGRSTRLSYAVGAGVERSVSSRFGLRLNGDYVGKPFVGSSDVVVTASIVFHPKSRFNPTR